MTLTIRPARPDEAGLVLAFIKELAEYERLSHEVVAGEKEIAETLFCANPKVHGLICEDGDTPVGFAVYFFNYSTWQGRHGLYLEDLYVSPEHRGKGAGMALLRQLARIAVDRDCGRFEWSVLDWNTRSIALYDRLGARPQSEWIRYRLTGDELHALAAQSQPLLQPSNTAP